MSMTNWFAYLKFKNVSDELRCTFQELDCYADYEFNNGIWIRVVKGLMAESIPLKPYEMIARHPHCYAYSIPNLDKHDVQNKMEELHNLKLKQ